MQIASRSADDSIDVADLVGENQRDVGRALVLMWATSLAARGLPREP